MASPNSSPSTKSKSKNEYANDDTIFCKCNLRTQRFTVRKEENYGRRFHGCRKYPGDGNCGFFKWLDGEFPEQAKAVIRDLVWKQKKLEEENGLLRSQMQDVFAAKHVICQRSSRVDEMDLVIKRDVSELKGYVIWTYKVLLVLVLGLVIACFTKLSLPNCVMKLE